MLTHRNLVANICQVDAASQIVREEDVVIGVLPFFHSYGLLVVLNVMLYKGATVVTMPRFELEAFLRTLQDYGVTRAYLVPPIILALAKHPLVEQYDLSKLRVIMSGAAPLSEAIARACAERLGCLVLQGYGLTETSPVTHANPEDPARIKLASIGPPLPNTECQIVDLETGASLGPDQVGEVWIRGPQVMKGYWKHPEETARTITADGWLRTGDIGRVDEDGYFYIVDRIKELIKYKGLQIAPAELEAVLLSHPAVADAAVIPSPDEEAGEVPKAFVVLKADASAEELMAYVAERVAPFKKIRRLEFVEQIPRSASGKILRRVLLERERGGSA
jgi:acyl-CoA synthetase (AMP-forming)/AMP-acid ligase II